MRALAHSGERGAAVVENALCVSVLFLLLMMLFEFGYSLLIRSVLEEGATQGLKLAQKLPDLNIDYARLDPSDPEDRDAINRYVRAREAAIDRALEIPLNTIFDRPNQPGMVRLLEFERTSEAPRGMESAFNVPALGALVQPGEEYKATTRDGKRVDLKYTKLIEAIDKLKKDWEKYVEERRGRSNGRARTAATGAGTGAGTGTKDAASTPPANLKDFPMVMRLCCERRYLFPTIMKAFLGRETSVLCASSVGFHSGIGAANVQVRFQASPTVTAVGIGLEDPPANDEPPVGTGEGPNDGNGAGTKPYPKPDCNRCKIVSCINSSGKPTNTCSFDRNPGGFPEADKDGQETIDLIRECGVARDEVDVSPTVPCDIITHNPGICSNSADVVKECGGPEITPPPPPPPPSCKPNGYVMKRSPQNAGKKRGPTLCNAVNNGGAEKCCSGVWKLSNPLPRGCAEEWKCVSQEEFEGQCETCGVVSCLGTGFSDILCKINATEEDLEQMVNSCTSFGSSGRILTKSGQCGSPSYAGACGQYTSGENPMCIRRPAGG